MGPSIATAIEGGFRATNKAWVGMAFIAGSWLLLIVISLLLLLLTKPPLQVFQEVSSKSNFSADLSPPTDDAPETNENKLSPEAQAALKGWGSRAWPLLVLVFTFFLFAGLFLFSGQVSYLANLVRGRPASIQTFLQEGGRNVFPIMNAGLLLLLAFLALFLAMGTIPALVAITGVKWLVVLTGLIFGTIGIVLSVWLNVRLAFTYIAIPINGLGPVQAMKSSFEATRGRWWPVFGFLTVLGIISAAAGIAFQVLGSLSGILGPWFVIPAFFLLQPAANIYIQFLTLACSIQYYLDATSSSDGNIEGPLAAA